MAQPFNSYPFLVARAPAATPSVYTTIASLKTVGMPELGSNEFDASVQQNTIDVYVVSPLLRRKAVSLVLNMLPSDPTQDHVAGLFFSKINTNFDGWKFSHAASGLVWVASGFITAIVPKTPFEGDLEVDVTLRLSGPMGIQSNSAGGMVQVGT